MTFPCSFVARWIEQYKYFQWLEGKHLLCLLIIHAVARHYRTYICLQSYLALPIALTGLNIGLTYLNDLRLHHHLRSYLCTFLPLLLNSFYFWHRKIRMFRLYCWDYHIFTFWNWMIILHMEWPYWLVILYMDLGYHFIW